MFYFGVTVRQSPKDGRRWRCRRAAFDTCTAALGRNVIGQQQREGVEPCLGGRQCELECVRVRNHAGMLTSVDSW